MNTYTPGATSRSSQPRGRRQAALLLLVAVVALGIGLVVGHWAIPATREGAAEEPSDNAGSGPATGLGAPHGPAKFTNGVPSGYTQDRPGAATAAVNMVQVLVATAHGQADKQTATEVILSRDAEPALRQAFETAAGDPGDQTSKTPVTTRVQSQSDTEATVEVWLASIGSRIGTGSTAVDWSTYTVTLVWEAEDWKAKAVSSKRGPDPGKADDSTAPNRVPVQGGSYTFYIG